MKEILVSVDKLKEFIKNVLLKIDVRDDVANYVAEGLVQTSLRGVDSHGIRLFPHYLKGVQEGRINPNPNYKFKKTSFSTGLLDADHTFGHAAGMEAVKGAIELANKAGTGQIAVYNSSHFGAAAYYALEIAKHDMIGMSFTNTDSLIQTYGGKRAFLGNNPICFIAPCEGEDPFCLDMATSITSFNKIRQLKNEGHVVLKGIGVNKDGIETDKLDEITTLLPIGGYKGYGLSLMVEILCSLLTGMPYGPNIPKMFEAPSNQRRFIGHFISAIRIDCFQDKNAFKNRLSQMIKELRNEPRLDKNIPIQIAGDPEKKMAEKRKKRGIPMKPKEYEIFEKIGKKMGIKFYSDLKTSIYK